MWPIEVTVRIKKNIHMRHFGPNRRSRDPHDFLLFFYVKVEGVLPKYPTRSFRFLEKFGQ